MKTEKIEKEEFGAFLKAQSTTDNRATVPDAIVKELVASKPRLGLVYLFGSVAGYFLTLLICAQCSIGLSPLAWKTASLFRSIPDPWCPLICGALFGIAPFLASAILLTRFQHRYLLFKMTWVPLLVPIAASALMTIAETPHSWEWQGLWIIAAVLTPYLFEVGSGLMLRQVRWKPTAT